ncbi:MAG: VOC family protein, partial [Gemmatimonadales bacterium]
AGPVWLSDEEEIEMANSGPNLALSAIGQIAITVADLETATEYYRDVLGMSLLFQAPGMSFFQCGEVRLMLGAAVGESGDQPTHIVYYKVDDIEAAHRTLVAKGVNFVHEPRAVHRTDTQELWLAFFRDPDGHTLALMSEVRV